MYDVKKVDNDCKSMIREEVLSCLFIMEQELLGEYDAILERETRASSDELVSPDKDGLNTKIKEDLLNRVSAIHNASGMLKNTSTNCVSESVPTFELNSLSILETQEIERKRIARDLHDTTVQNLTSMVHKVEYCTKLIDVDTIQAKLELQIMIQVIRSTISEMRDIIYNLRPMELDDLGLTATIQNFIKQMSEQDVVKFHFILEGIEISMRHIVNLTLFRIIKEASNNAMKHAKPNNIWIKLIYERDRVVIKIKDDGSGFQINEKVCNISNFGLSIMRERIQLLNGEISIDSVKNKGTEVNLSVPNTINLEEVE